MKWCTRLDLIIVVVHVGAVKIYVAVDALRKKERRCQNPGSNSVWHKKWCNLSKNFWKCRHSATEEYWGNSWQSSWNAEILQLKNTGVRLYGAAGQLKKWWQITPVFMDCRCNAKDGHRIRNSLHRQVGVVVVLLLHLLRSSKNSLRKVGRSLE
jgi:hypothetical protein